MSGGIKASAIMADVDWKSYGVVSELDLLGGLLRMSFALESIFGQQLMEGCHRNRFWTRGVIVTLFWSAQQKDNGKSQNWTNLPRLIGGEHENEDKIAATSFSKKIIISYCCH